MTPWTFINVSQRGSPSIYGPPYDRAATEGVARTSGGAFEAHILRDGDLANGGEGWWSKASLFCPHLETGTDDVIYYADLDTVFMRDLPGLAAAMDAVDADIVGLGLFRPQDPWTSGVLRIRRSAVLPLWDLYRAEGPQPLRSRFDFWVRRAAEKCGVTLGHVGDEWVQSYKVHTRHFPGQKCSLDGASVMVFHGLPRVQEVWDYAGAPLNGLVRENWRP